MPKKQIIGSIIIIIILSFICMLIYDKFKDNNTGNEIKLITEDSNSRLTLYYTDKNKNNYYLYGISGVVVDYNDHMLDLNKALEAKQITIDEVIEIIGNSNKISYSDGSIKINNNDISLLQCNNNDYYLGKSDMEYKSGFCENKPYVCSFTKTYLVYNVIESNDEDYVYLTLKSNQEEDVFTVKVDRSLNEEIIENEYYEFTFTSDDINNIEDIDNIFSNNRLISIKISDKDLVNQTNDIMCR